MTKANTTPTASAGSISIMYAASVSLNFYWLLVFFKHSVEPISDALNWYPPVGPLLALFILSLVAFGVSCWLFNRRFSEQGERSLKRHQALAAQTLVVSTILVFLMTFPPIFEPIADAIF